MDPSLILPYLWVLLVLVFLEGLLAADNAIVMAVMVKHLPPKQRKKALFYGLLGAFIFRFIALFLISIIANFWWIQAAGAVYLIYMSIKNLWQFFHQSNEKHHKETGDEHHFDETGNEKEVGPKSFWGTVFKVEFADIAFAIDSMLAALAIAVTLPKVGIHFGGMDLGQFIVMFLGGMIGAAFAIVGWVGIKLVIMVLAHPDIGVLPEAFPHSALWQTIFWVVLVGLVLIGWLTSAIGNKKKGNQK